MAIIAGALVVIGIYLIFRSHAATNNADFNNSGTVDVVDLSILAAHFGTTTGGTQAQGDANGDGAINILDLSILASQWGTTSTTSPQPSLPIRAMFYYPWFPEAWNQQGFNPFTNYSPTNGFYSSTDSTIINKHIDDMIYAGMNSAIFSWWGQGSKEDTRFQPFLNATGNKPLKWALYYECEGNSGGGTCGSIGGPSPTTAGITSDLSYIKSKYASNPNYLKIGGKPVIFVYGDGTDSCSRATAWKNANANQGFYVVLKVFGGYATCADQPDNWHQYGPASAQDVQGTHSISISPGYWKKGCPSGGGVCTQGDTQPFLGRDLTRWNTNVTALKNSTANLELVTTYNEWGEGSIVESANGSLPTGWQSGSGHGQFIDVLHQILVTGAPTDNPPTVALTAPTAGTKSGNVTLTATSSDDHGVSKVEFLVGGTVVNTSGASPASPYSFSWNSASVANGSYTITARATDTTGQTTTSAGVAVTVSNTVAAPTVPTGLTATAASSTQVNLSWNASTDTGGPGLAKYEISRNGTVIANVNAPTTSFSDTTVVASTTYSYTVKAVDTAGNKSAASVAATVTTPANTDNIKPTVPGNFVASLPVSTAKTVHLSWSASTDTGGSGLKGYILSRNGTVIATPVAGVNSFDDTTTVYATAYSYTIAATDNASNTSAAATSSITTPAAPPETQAPDVPTATATVISTTQVTISWNAVADNPKTGGASGVKGYRVFRNGTQIADVLAPSTSTNDGPFSFASGQSYSYTVLAYDVVGNASAQSAASSVIPNPVVTAGRCGNASTGNKITTVVVIAEENRSWSGVGGVGFSATSMPYVHGLAQECAVFQNDTEVDTGDNSATQYVGSWTGYGPGVTHVTSDCSPSSSCSYTGNNLFRAFRNSGIGHREYVEGPTTTCSASGNAAKHIPELYMYDPTDKAACNAEVLPISGMDFANPPTGFTFITPNLCNDGHDSCGTNTVVDNWLASPSRLPALINSPAYKAGKVLIEVWWDEDHPKPNLFICSTCKNISSSTDPHYSGESLLWLNVLGAPTSNLGGISTATDIRSIIGAP